MNASLQIPFSVPPYMSLLARAVATLEGIALSGNPDYQMIAEVWPISCAVHPWPNRLCHWGNATLALLHRHVLHGHSVAATSRPATIIVSCDSESALEMSGAPVQAYPFVVRKVLRNSSSGSRSLLRDIVFDAQGNVKPARMSAVLNAALGYVAEQTDGFVDFDAVPAEGAPLQVSISKHP